MRPILQVTGEYRRGHLNRYHPFEGRLLAGGVLLAALLSGLAPHDRVVWVLETIPVLLVAGVLWASDGRLPLTRLSRLLLFAGGLVMLVGAHYCYARVPIGEWIEEVCHLSRNPYDRIGHFGQGLVPGVVLRELFRRRTSLRGAWLGATAVAYCIAISAIYEILEWWVSVAGGMQLDPFLGAQGDVWDTQWDMFLATLGAVLAQLALGGAVDRASDRAQSSLTVS